MNRRRGPGIGAITRGAKAQKQFHDVGAQLEASQLEHIERQLALFKEKLEIFANKHKNQINKNPKFRAQFQTMCAKVGVDPLASRKGFWTQLLGVGDFYYELGVQIINVCLSTRTVNGGLIGIDELLVRLKVLRGKNANEISTEDIHMSIKKISKLGNGFDLVKVGNKEMIVSVPIEMNRDHFTIMEVAQKDTHVNVQQLCSQLQWTKHRVDAVLQLLLEQGMVWVDTQGSATTSAPSTTSSTTSTDDSKILEEIEAMEKEVQENSSSSSSMSSTISHSTSTSPKVTLFWFPSLWLNSQSAS